VTVADPTGECRLAVGYEQVRSGVLEGRSAGGHFGLVLLLREGVAAWMTHTPPPPATIARADAKERPATAPPLILDDLRADMARVLASMVMTTPEERCT
jgi:hypothetical protein